jgi:hypothetical protein
MQFRFVFLTIFLAIQSNTFAQNVNGYIILTFEQTHKISQHGTKVYHWIIPDDSLTDYETSFAHLFLDGLSDDQISSCCNKQPMDPVLVFPDSKFGLDSTSRKIIKDLSKLLIKDRKKIQTIIKQWDDQKETIKVFATAISGQFCFSPFDEIGQQRTGYHGLVSVPHSNCRVFREFWSSDKAKFIIHRDFSKIPFDIIQYPN